MSTATTIHPVAASELVELSYVMRADVAEAFQRETTPILERLIQALAGDDFDLATFDSSLVTPPYPGNNGPKDAWLMPPITRSDIKLVCWVVDNWTDSGRKLAGGLLSVPDHEVRTRTLAKHVGYDKAVPSAFRAMANRLRSIDRRPFWFGDLTTKAHPDGQLLSVQPRSGPYAVIQEVFEARYPELLNWDSSGS